jgi:hypothetical protein
MSLPCVECQLPVDVPLLTRGCPCVVHEQCWNRRLGLCMQVSVAQVRCSSCWTVLWSQESAHKRQREEDELPMMKKLRI